MYIVFILLLFVLFDFIYVSLIASKYNVMIRSIQKTSSNIYLPSAILSYIVLLITLIWVVFPYAQLRKSIDKSRLKTAFYSGLLIGFAIYGVFNTTNVALFKDYSFALAILDTLWGSLLFFTICWLYLYLSSPRVLFILKPCKQ